MRRARITVEDLEVLLARLAKAYGRRVKLEFEVAPGGTFQASLDAGAEAFAQELGEDLSQALDVTLDAFANRAAVHADRHAEAGKVLGKLDARRRTDDGGT